MAAEFHTSVQDFSE